MGRTGETGKIGKYSAIWAKKPIDGKNNGESLVEHTLRVWASFEGWYARWPLPKTGLTSRLCLQIALAIILHDLGKGAPGFQTMLRGGKRFPYRHEIISAGIAPLVLPGSNEAEFFKDKEGNASDPGDLPWVAAGILSHHKDLSYINQNYPAPPLVFPPLPDNLETLAAELGPDFFNHLPGIWREITDSLKDSLLFRQMADALSLRPIPANIEVGAFAKSMRVAVSAYNLLVARMEREPYNSEITLAGRYLRGMVIMSDHAGSAHQEFQALTALDSVSGAAQALGIMPSRMLGRKQTGSDIWDLDDLDSVYRHQAVAAQTRGNSLLIAPTGSGKTEAALLWAAANAPAEGNSPVFYVLPYQASLNAMRFRLGRSFGDEHVVLQHSRSLSALYRFLLDREYDRISAKKMARQEINLGRLHLAPVRILTPYQLLRGPFQLKGHEALLTDTVGGRFIIDEVHAYEPKRLGMIMAALAHLVHDLEARILVMSATMPSVCQEFLADRLGVKQRITASAAAFTAFRRHRLHLWDYDLWSERIVGEICDQALGGKKVLVTATTVARAQEIRRRIIERLKLKGKTGDTWPVELLHGKFCARDRFSKERELLDKAATRRSAEKASWQPAKGFVLVATQVVEVSLDIDFDVLFTDPAPLEALFQRFGRINRGRHYPECGVHVMLQIPDQSPVYDEMLVRRSLEELKPLNGEMLDESRLQAVLDRVYAGPINAWWGKEVGKAFADFSNRVLSSLYPFNSANLEEMFYEMFDGAEVLPLDLFAEYQAAMENEPLEAGELMVPVTRRQFWQLKRDMLPQSEPGLYIVRRPYSKEYGLILNQESLNEGI